jgi:hypothetical protein
MALNEKVSRALLHSYTKIKSKEPEEIEETRIKHAENGFIVSHHHKSSGDGHYHSPKEFLFKTKSQLFSHLRTIFEEPAISGRNEPEENQTARVL